MREVPAGWKMSTLDDLRAPDAGSMVDGPFGSNLKTAHYTESGPQVVRLQNIGEGVYRDALAHISEEHFKRLRKHEVVPGDLLVASLGEVLPRACLMPEYVGPAIVKADCIRVRLSDIVDPRWVMYSLLTPETRRWAEARTHGVGRPRLGLRLIRQIPVPLPPLDEQRKIVEILEDHLSRLDEAAALVGSVLKRIALFEESVIVRSLGVGEQVAGIIDGALPDLERGWTWRTLGEVAEVVGGVTKDSKKQSDPAFVEVPYLRVANVQRARLDLRDVATIRVAPARAEALRLIDGDVLMNEGGDRDKLARGWVWERQIEGCIHQNHVFRARPDREVVRSEWLAWCANTYGARWAQRHGRQSVNLASISQRVIRTMPIPVPPVEEQDRRLARIGDVIDSTARLRREVEHAQSRAAALRRALLAAAFSGRLTGSSSDTERIEELVEAGV